jgi:hypothetical protein
LVLQDSGAGSALEDKERFPMNQRFVIKLLIIVSLCCSLPLAADQTERYVNARYGYGINIPDGFVAQPESANGDGRKYTAADPEVGLLVYGSNNLDESGLKATLHQALKDLPVKPTYQDYGDTWFVLSWLQGDTIHYCKTFVGPGSTNSFWLSYPKALSKTYDPVAAELEGSFRPGDLEIGH